MGAELEDQVSKAPSGTGFFTPIYAPQPPGRTSPRINSKAQPHSLGLGSGDNSRPSGCRSLSAVNLAAAFGKGAALSSSFPEQRLDRTSSRSTTPPQQQQQQQQQLLRRSWSSATAGFPTAAKEPAGVAAGAAGATTSAGFSACFAQELASAEQAAAAAPPAMPQGSLWAATSSSSGLAACDLAHSAAGSWQAAAGLGAVPASLAVSASATAPQAIPLPAGMTATATSAWQPELCQFEGAWDLPNHTGGGGFGASAGQHLPLMAMPCSASRSAPVPIPEDKRGLSSAPSATATNGLLIAESLGTDGDVFAGGLGSSFLPGASSDASLLGDSSLDCLLLAGPLSMPTSLLQPGSNSQAGSACLSAAAATGSTSTGSVWPAGFRSSALLAGGQQQQQHNDLLLQQQQHQHNPPLLLEQQQQQQVWGQQSVVASTAAAASSPRPAAMFAIDRELEQLLSLRQQLLSSKAEVAAAAAAGGLGGPGTGSFPLRRGSTTSPLSAEPQNALQLMSGLSPEQLSSSHFQQLLGQNSPLPGAAQAKLQQLLLMQKMQNQLHLELLQLMPLA